MSIPTSYKNYNIKTIYKGVLGISIYLVNLLGPLHVDMLIQSSLSILGAMRQHKIINKL